MINREKFHSIEAVGILACFCGVIMMAMSEDSSGIDGNQGGSWGDLARVIGVLVMVFVAFNDGLTFVMARTMKSIHFSGLMFSDKRYVEVQEKLKKFYSVSFTLIFCKFDEQCDLEYFDHVLL